MSKWLDKFLQKECRNGTDKTDNRRDLSVMSVPPRGVFDKKVENIPETRTDKTDRFNIETNMSVLSVPSWDPSQKISFYPSAGDSLLHDFEERLAIAEYDGHQNATQAQRIAYQDAFISVLNTFPYEDMEEGDWFEKKIRSAKEWLISQGIGKPS